MDFSVINLYNLTYETTDTNGLTTTKTVDIAVTTIPSIVIDGNRYVPGDTIVTLENEPFTFPDATGTGGLGEVLPVTDDRANIDLTTRNDYTLTYNVVDPYGYTDSASIIIRVKGEPQIIINGYDDGDTIATTVGVPIPSPSATAEDDNGNSITVLTDAGGVDFSTAGIYPITYTATDGDGVVITASLNVVVTTFPSITINGHASGDTIVTVIDTPITIPSATAVDGNGATITVIDDSASVDFSTTGAYTITYNATDQYGISSTAILNVLVHNLPVITIAGYTDNQTIGTNVGQALVIPTATALDHDGNNITVVIDSTSVDVNTIGEYTIRYTATDINSLSKTDELNIVITSSPVITLSNSFVDGDTIAIARGTSATLANDMIPSATAVDGENNTLPVSDDRAAIDYNTSATYTVTYIATDQYDISSTVTLEIIVRDSPTITLVGGTSYSFNYLTNTLIGNILTIPSSTAVDALGNAVTVTDNIADIDFSVPVSNIVTYSATDDLGLTTIEEIYVVVTTLPNLINVIDGDIIGVEIMGTANDLPVVTAVDGLGGALTVVDDLTLVDFNTIGDYVATYTATDNFGHSSTASVTVVIDTLPTIVINGYNDGDTIYVPLNIIPVVIPTAIATNRAGENVNLVTTGTPLDSSIADTPNTITYEATETNGLSSTATIDMIFREIPSITFDDALIISGDVLNTLTNTPIAIPNVTAMDADGNVLIPVDDRMDVDFDTKGVYTITYEAIDAFGVANSVTIDINVRTLPVITISGGHVNGETIPTAISTPITIPTATAVDSEGEITTIVMTGDNLVDFDTAGEYVVSYSTTDDLGYTSTATVIIKVIVPPVISFTGVGANNQIATVVGIPIALPTATAVDGEGNNVTVTDDSAIIVDFNTIGEQIITYTAEDNFEITSTDTVTLIVVANAPLITLIGAMDGDNRLSPTGTQVTFPTAIAIDGNGVPITVQVTDDLDVNTVGTYTVRYSASDQYGITSEASITYTIMDPPTIELDGGVTQDGDVLVTLIGNPIAIPVVTSATDNQGNPLVPTTQGAGLVDFNTRGDYVVEYSATDANGFETMVSVTITVLNSGPIISFEDGLMNGDTIQLVVNVSTTDDIPIATAVDGDGSTLTVTDDRDNIDFSTTGMQAVDYVAVDSYGFIATARLNIEITEQPPIITIDGRTAGDRIILPLDSFFLAPTATAVDSLGNLLPVTIDETMVDYSTVGEYPITYTATDLVNDLTTVDSVFIVVSESLIGGLTPTLTYNTTGEYDSIQNTAPGGLDTENATIIGSFNLATTPLNDQIVFETGGIATGLSITINDNNEFVVSIGNDNTDDITVSDIQVGVDYSFVLSIDLDNDEVNLWVEAVSHPISILQAHEVSGTATFLGADWSDGNGMGIGVVNSTAQGPYFNTLPDFGGTVENISIYSEQLPNTD